jgi:hypothetical protein
MTTTKMKETISLLMSGASKLFGSVGHMQNYTKIASDLDLLQVYGRLS